MMQRVTSSVPDDDDIAARQGPIEEHPAENRGYDRDQPKKLRPCRTAGIASNHSTTKFSGRESEHRRQSQITGETQRTFRHH